MFTVGIDLGTTNTVVAANAGVLPLRSPNGATAACHAMPSVVAFAPNGATLVGGEARERRAIDPANTIFGAKRIIGEPWHSIRVQQFRKHYPMQVTEAQGFPVLQTRLGDVTPTQVATQVVSESCRWASLTPTELGAVVGVPASFEEGPRQATMAALRAAGFREVRCIYEPIATALSYLDRNSVHYAAVYDLGGGTFDVAIIDCSQYPLRVLGHAGDPYLGGDDIDRALAQHIASEILKTRGWDLANDREVFGRVLLEAERAKIALSDHESVLVDLEHIDPAAPVHAQRLQIDRDVLWQLAAPWVQRTFAICDEVLSQTGLRTDDIDAVFGAGGSCRMPGLSDAVGAYFGRRLRAELDPMHVVAIGTSLAAARPALQGLLE